MSEWSFCNRWLREQSKLPQSRRNTLIFCGLEQSGLESVLDLIQQFEVRMNFGKVQVEVTRKLDKNAGTIELFVGDSKEMYS